MRVELVRQLKGIETREVEYYVTSLVSGRATALELLRWVRAQWAIQNQLHHGRE